MNRIIGKSKPNVSCVYRVRDLRMCYVGDEALKASFHVFCEEVEILLLHCDVAETVEELVAELEFP